MKRIQFLVFILLASISLNAQDFNKVWEVDALEAPESVVYNSDDNVFYISNVAGQPAEKNGLGYISVMSRTGELTDQKWITGLNAPKGLAIAGGLLYIADIDRVVVAEIDSGNIVKEYQAEGATFLNDIAVDESGSVYITDTFGGNAVYRIKEGQIGLWLKDDKLNYPNGLTVKNNKLFVSTWGVVTNPETFGTDIPGRLLSIDLSDRSIAEISAPFGNLDGLQLVSDKFLVSDWIAGGLLTVDQNGSVAEVYDLDAGSADILYLPEEELLLVPQMLNGSLTAYSVSQ